MLCKHMLLWFVASNAGQDTSEVDESRLKCLVVTCFSCSCIKDVNPNIVPLHIPPLAIKEWCIILMRRCPSWTSFRSHDG